MAKLDREERELLASFERAEWTRLPIRSAKTLRGSSRSERPQAVRKRTTSPRSQTDWRRVDRMGDEDIDLSEVPEIPPEMFAKAVVRKGLKPVPRKDQITL